MEEQEIINKYSSFFKKNWIALLPGIVGLILLSYGLISLVTSSDNSDKILFIKGDKPEVLSTQDKKREIMVDIEGAVISPGVYNLSSDARIKDALIAAGGLSSNADREWVAKNLNLASRLADGNKLYVPFKGETSMQGFSSESVNLSSNLININSASLEELESLSGVGLITAQKIIGGRPYQKIDELILKKILGKSVFERIKDRITVY